MSSLPRIALAQIDTLVGDLPGNAQKIVDLAIRARDEQGAHLVVFPELTLTGYPPEDLLLRPSLETRVKAALKQIMEQLQGVDVLFGLPLHEKGRLYNSAVMISDGKLVASYHKRCLPNYQVFDEKRYFHAGDSACVVDWMGVRLGITICEDIWEPGPARDSAQAGAQLLINLNASPFHLNKQFRRENLLRDRAQSNRLPIVYVNLVGGQDELVFDGGSMVVKASGEKIYQAPWFEECLAPLDISVILDELPGNDLKALPHATDDALLYQALVLSVRDYVNKNRFSSVIIGLSGGIDSALTLAIACDALGADRVRAVMMPFRYTSEMSLVDARAEADALGIRYDVVSIEPIIDAFMAQLGPLFEGLPRDTTEENLQARARGTLLMSLSNKTGALVLTTGNKSEMAVGYATLYGDMAGGFDVLKDVYKTTVYRLSRYRNTLGSVIPERVITRAPSAELAPDQKDEDSLPPYPMLDQILELYIEQDFSAEAIVERGFAREIVYRVARLVDINEYKRRQAPVGPRLTPRGFGKDRRYPITSGWKLGH